MTKVKANRGYTGTQSEKTHETRVRLEIINVVRIGVRAYPTKRNKPRETKSVNVKPKEGEKKKNERERKKKIPGNSGTVVSRNFASDHERIIPLVDNKYTYNMYDERGNSKIYKKIYFPIFVIIVIISRYFIL